MKEQRLYKYTIRLLVCILFFVFTISSLSQVKKEKEGIKSITKDGGWDIPWNNAVLTYVDEKKEEIQYEQVIKRTLLMKNKLTINVDTYFVLEDGGLKIRTFMCSVDRVCCYVYNEKIFAYEVHLIPISLDVQGHKTSFGSVFIFRYYDDDGNGSFETLEYNSFSMRLANWIGKTNKSEDDNWIRPN